VTSTCTAPEVLCAGVCVNPSSDAKNCGGCGNDCGVGRSCASGTCTPAWAPVSSAGAPTARSRAAYASLSSVGQVFVWGGLDGASTPLDDGAIYDVATNAWVAVAKDASTPSARELASAVWTGDRVFVWGGGNGTADLGTGALYDPVAKSWQPVATAGAPSPRRAAYVVWTGAEVLVWAGLNAAGAALTGAFRYDPQTDKWTTGATASEPSARSNATTGWSGSDFLVYGGKQGNTHFNQAYRYRPSNDAWAVLPNGPSQRFGAFGTWDGSYLVAWAGRKEGGGAPATYDDGKRFDGSVWVNLPNTGVPTARYAPHREAGFSARVANGATLMVGGRSPSTAALKDGGIYRSGTNSWSPVPAWPSGEDHLWAAWGFAGGELVVFGGSNGSATTATGERFRP
jgi:hypothetical protein